LPHSIPIFLDYISGNWTLLFDACMSWIHRELYQKGTWIFTLNRTLIVRNKLRKPCWLFLRQVTMDLCFYDCRLVAKETEH
jgi:hypothetical protein